MNSKRKLIVSIFQLIIGILAIVAFVVAAISGESMLKWTITLILAIGYVVCGIIGIMDYKSN